MLYSPDSTLLPVDHQKSKMLHILTIGANLIAQSRVDSYPVRIACTVNVGGTPKVMEAVGAPRLPYLNSLADLPGCWHCYFRFPDGRHQLATRA